MWCARTQRSVDRCALVLGVERSRAGDDGTHISYFGRVPTADVLVEMHVVVEHFVHARHRRCIPL